MIIAYKKRRLSPVSREVVSYMLFVGNDGVSFHMTPFIYTLLYALIYALRTIVLLASLWKAA